MELIQKRQFVFWSVAPQGDGISGGDRIFIELARRWSEEYPLTIYTWKEGERMCKRQGLVEENFLRFKDLNIHISSDRFVLSYITRITEAVKTAFRIKLEKDTTYYIYSSSEFWMDSLPAFILKMRFPEVIWFAAWYQTAPKPWTGFTLGDRKKKYKLSALYYWLAQLPVKPLIAKYADFVFVNNESEKKQFPRLNKLNHTIVVIGAVNLKDRDEYQRKFQELPKIYDAVFQGRFHPQKGVVELIDIWRKVVNKKPKAKLAMIGDGPLMAQVKSKIEEYNLENNIQIFGYVFDGSQKYKIFNQSKVVVHPAFFDSGGMAAAEAMMFGLPCIGFALEAYKSYYTKGMVKVKIGDLNAFADEVLKLLNNNIYRKKIAREAVAMIEQNWSWDKRSKQLIKELFK